MQNVLKLIMFACLLTSHLLMTLVFFVISVYGVGVFFYENSKLIAVSEFVMCILGIILAIFYFKEEVQKWIKSR